MTSRPCSLECVINGPWSCWAWLLLLDGSGLQTTPWRQQTDKKRRRLTLLRTAQIDKLDGEPVNKNNHLPWCKQKNTMAIGGWTDFWRSLMLVRMNKMRWKCAPAGPEAGKLGKRIGSCSRGWRRKAHTRPAIPMRWIRMGSR